MPAPIVSSGPEIPSVADLELWILGAYYRILKQGRDRGSNELTAPDPNGPGLISAFEPISGFTASDALRKPAYAALAGEALAYQSPLDFYTWACAFMGRTDDQTGRRVTLDQVKRDLWTEEEKGRQAVLEHRLRVCVARMAERGLFDTRPDFGPDGERLPLENGLPTTLAKITPRGLREACRRIPGTRYERGPVSRLATAPDHVRAAAPEYARREWRQEG